MPSFTGIFPTQGIKLLSPVISLHCRWILTAELSEAQISTGPPTQIHHIYHYLEFNICIEFFFFFFSGKIYKQWNPHILWTTQWILTNTYNCITQPLVKERYHPPHSKAVFRLFHSKLVSCCRTSYKWTQIVCILRRKTWDTLRCLKTDSFEYILCICRLENSNYKIFNLFIHSSFPCDMWLFKGKDLFLFVFLAQLLQIFNKCLLMS